jgi:hypothetical protein
MLFTKSLVGGFDTAVKSVQFWSVIRYILSHKCLLINL